MAWEISNHDKDFILLIKSENGQLTTTRKHNISHWCARTQRMEDDWGLGISACYHPSITGDPRFWTDPYWNIQQTYRLYKGGTKFYAYPKRHKVAKYFTF